MSPLTEIGLPEALERAAGALPQSADAIRPANGDPLQVYRGLGDEGAARVLGWLLANEPDAGAELAQAWADDPEVGTEALTGVDEQSLPKPGRKALRRARHRMRSRGVAWDEPRPAPMVATLPPVADELPMAMLSSLDPRGSCVAYLVERHPGGGARIFEVLLDEERGVVEFDVYTTGRSRARRFLREFSRRASYPGVEAPPQAVRALIARIAAGQPESRPAPRGFAEWRTRLAPEGDASETPGTLARAALGDEVTPGALERAAELVRERQLGPWPAPSEALKPVGERIEAAVGSALVVSDRSRQEQIDGVLDDALEEVFDAAHAGRTARRFEESAFILWKGGADEDARACLAAARALGEGPVRGHPAARAMLDVLFAPALEKRGEPEPGPSSLVAP